MGALLTLPGEVFGRISHYESYKYTVLKDYGQWSVRRYAPAVAAEAGGAGEDENKSFMRLAKYIGVFGKPENTAGTAVAMTTPVVSEPIAMTTPVVSEPIAMTTPVVTEGKATRQSPMRFILPSKYSTAAEAPKPNDPGIRLVDVPAKFVAALRFNGSCKGCEAALPRYEELRTLVKDNGLEEAGHWELHRYNAPFTVPYFRRNEVLVPLTKESLAKAGLEVGED